MIIVFIVGYVLIALEHPLKLNKSATALLLAVIMWILFVFSEESIRFDAELMKHLAMIEKV